MTKAAHHYYTERLQQMHIPAVPIFDGEFHSLMPPDIVNVRIASPPGKFVDALKPTLQSVHLYVTRGRPPVSTECDTRTSNYNKQCAEQFYRRALLKEEEQTGTLHGVGVEAIAPDELTENMRLALSAYDRKNIDWSNKTNAVFLVISGLLKVSSYTSHYRAGLAMVSTANTPGFKVPAPRYVIGRFNKPGLTDWQDMRQA